MDYGDFDDGNGRYFFKINVAEFGMKDTMPCPPIYLLYNRRLLPVSVESMYSVYVVDFECKLL